jgi:Flp pilus assembly protein TadG
MTPIFAAMRKRRKRGNAVLEVALGAPVMFLMLSGVIDFGRAYYFADAAASAARAGAQYGIESPANVGNTGAMQAAAQDDAHGIPISATVTWPYCLDSSGTSVAPVSGVCPVNTKTNVKVSTTLTYNLMIPWPGLPNPLNIGGVAIMRVE